MCENTLFQKFFLTFSQKKVYNAPAMTTKAYNLFLELVCELKSKGYTISCAESCTGGMFASFVTNVEGSSSVLKYGYVTYHPESKNALVGVSLEDIEKFGVVSCPVAEQMSVGALMAAKADVAMGVTGNIGNTTNDDKGTLDDVWLSVVVRRDGDKVEGVTENISFANALGDKTGANSHRIIAKESICIRAAEIALELLRK